MNTYARHQGSGLTALTGPVTVWALILVVGLFNAGAIAHVHLDKAKTDCSVCLLPTSAQASPPATFHIPQLPRVFHYSEETQSTLASSWRHFSPRAPPLS